MLNCRIKRGQVCILTSALGPTSCPRRLVPSRQRSITKNLLIVLINIDMYNKLSSTHSNYDTILSGRKVCDFSLQFTDAFCCLCVVSVKHVLYISDSRYLLLLNKILQSTFWARYLWWSHLTVLVIVDSRPFSLHCHK